MKTIIDIKVDEIKKEIQRQREDIKNNPKSKFPMLKTSKTDTSLEYKDYLDLIERDLSLQKNRRYYSIVSFIGYFGIDGFYGFIDSFEDGNYEKYIKRITNPNTLHAEDINSLKTLEDIEIYLTNMIKINKNIKQVPKENIIKIRDIIRNFSEILYSNQITKIKDDLYEDEKDVNRKNKIFEMSKFLNIKENRDKFFIKINERLEDFKNNDISLTMIEIFKEM